MECIQESGVFAFGKKHKKRKDYYHPSPKIGKEAMLEELSSLYVEIRA